MTKSSSPQLKDNINTSLPESPTSKQDEAKEEEVIEREQSEPSTPEVEDKGVGSPSQTANKDTENNM